ncbi:hypothetical protein D8674_015760 [Pyrus ussuriensis x Pyrus communis]|uniref:Uncharacterized protein n=1 Tax=Pyrus ussuriensis x Pyrus communis TaxID=2448454 RepID=A0A5N5HF49_9ROSA|nr:hypothetical protein D8674_042899 [Pyrus ussuriensis x Pyrus communis]KAB2624100.1 hypothetical protein D8674_015760 [Pyrus ussuriensis x Pyrus communis]
MDFRTLFRTWPRFGIQRLPRGTAILLTAEAEAEAEAAIFGYWSWVTVGRRGGSTEVGAVCDKLPTARWIRL